jgi:hypothetical protein
LLRNEFSNVTKLLTALTGSAAMEIGCRTAAKVYAYLRKQDYARKDIIQFYSYTGLSVIDEIAFASYKQVLGEISKNLIAFTECHEHIYGKHGICFLT